MSLEILENIIPPTKFRIQDMIRGISYEFTIGDIVECKNYPYIRCKLRTHPCNKCTISLSYLSKESGVAYCSNYPFVKSSR